MTDALIQDDVLSPESELPPTPGASVDLDVAADPEAAPMSRAELRERLEQAPFFADLPPEVMLEVAAHADECRFRAQHRLFAQDSPARELFLVVDGEVSIEIPAIMGEPVQIHTLGPGSVLGWSWVVEPYEWRFDARAHTDTRLIRIDGERLRAQCEADPALGYLMLKRTAALMQERLMASRLRLIELYAGS